MYGRWSSRPAPTWVIRLIHEVTEPFFRHPGDPRGVHNPCKQRDAGLFIAQQEMAFTQPAGE
jgi:hypothetical protein